MDPKTKTEFWQKHFSAWEQSGLTQAAYCKEHDLKVANFSYWRTREYRKQRKLVPIALPDSGERITIDLPGGIRLDVSEAALANALPIAIRSLREAG